MRSQDEDSQGRSDTEMETNGTQKKAVYPKVRKDKGVVGWVFCQGWYRVQQKV